MAFHYKKKDDEWKAIPQEEKKSIVKRLKEGINNTIDNKMDQVTAMAQSKYYDKWKKNYGDGKGGIDWHNPHVQCESTLCDLTVIAILTDRKMTTEVKYAKVRNKFTDEGWECYLTGCDSAGVPYVNIEKKSIKKESVKQMGGNIKQKFKRHK